MSKELHSGSLCSGISTLVLLKILVNNELHMYIVRSRKSYYWPGEYLREPIIHKYWHRPPVSKWKIPIIYMFKISVFCTCVLWITPYQLINIFFLRSRKYLKYRYRNQSVVIYQSYGYLVYLQTTLAEQNQKHCLKKGIFIIGQHSNS